MADQLEFIPAAVEEPQADLEMQEVANLERNNSDLSS